MKVLAVHPGGLMYTRVFLRLEPLGLETVVAVIREAGHDVRLIDLQVESHRDLASAKKRHSSETSCGHSHVGCSQETAVRLLG